MQVHACLTPAILCCKHAASGLFEAHQTLLLTDVTGECQISIGTSLIQHPNFDHTSTLLTPLGLLLGLEIREPQFASQPSPSLAARALKPPPLISSNTTRDWSASATRSLGAAVASVTAPATLFFVTDGETKPPEQCCACLHHSQHDCMKSLFCCSSPFA